MHLYNSFRLGDLHNMYSTRRLTGSKPIKTVEKQIVGFLQLNP